MDGYKRELNFLFTQPVLPFVAAGTVLAVARVPQLPDPGSKRWALQVLCAGLVAVLFQGYAAYTVRDEHAVQEQAGREFVRWASRFPEGRFGEANITAQQQARVSVCAHEGPWEPPSPNSDKMLCVDIDTHRPAGEGVTGGYHYWGDASREEAPAEIEPLDCFGYPNVVCP